MVNWIGHVFVSLNIADAWLTNQLIAMGSHEGNPIVVTYGYNMLVKALLALAVVLLLVRFGKSKLLWVLNICMLAVVIWNGTWLWIS
jgi:hypothetical protein